MGLIKAAFADEATIFLGAAGAGLDGAEDTWVEDLVSSEGFDDAFAAAAGSLPAAIASSASLLIKKIERNLTKEIAEHTLFSTRNMHDMGQILS